MGMRLLTRSFASGEITPELFGRIELPKVQEALALCYNFITLPHGPAINRPGLQFVQEVKNSAVATRLIPFSYNNAQTFAIEVGAGYFRWHTGAATLQYSAPAAYNAGTTYNQGDMCSTGGVNYYCMAATTGNTPAAAAWSNVTAYTVGNLVTYGGITYSCTVANTGNTPGYTSPANPYWSPLWYALPADLTYEIPNTYAAADLFDIHYTQSADVLTLTHPSYPIAELRRYGATNWRTSLVSFGPLIAAPIGSGLAGTPIAHTYAVGAQAGLASSPLSASSSCNNDLTQPGACNTLVWNAVPNAANYWIYKQISGVFYLYAITSSTNFRDDSSYTQPTAWPYGQPYVAGGSGLATPTGVTATAFAASASATSLTVAPTGTGTTSYSYVATAVDESGNESGVSNTATCTNNLLTVGNFNTLTIPSVAGAVRYNLYRLSYGAWGYIGQAAPPATGVLTFVDNNITPDISRTAPIMSTGTLSTPTNYPAAVTYYQGRRWFAGSASQPQNVWATRSGTETDLAYTIPTRDDNRIAFRVAGREASAIRHLVPMQELLLLSASCEWRCSSTTGVLTPTTINVQPQSYIGASNVQPVVIGSAVLYAAARGGHLRQMNYNWQINGYQSTDASIFAPHLFDYNTITDMAYSRGPIPILWCVSSSGKLLGMTYIAEQQIAAWHQHGTGASDVFESVCCIAESNEDMLYCVVRRTINGVSKRYIERLHSRLYSTLADAFYVDSGVTYDGNASGAIKNGTYAGAGTTITCTITAHGLTDQQSYWFAFSDANYGSLPSGKKYQITKIDANTFTIVVTANTSTSGTVSYLPNVISGLTWLNGMTVNILADGAVIPQQVVAANAITLPVGASKVQIGLPITAQLQTPPVAQQLDPAFMQGRTKNVNKVFLRVYRSSGVMVGQDFADLTQYAQRSTETYGNPPALVSDEIEIVLDNDWGTSGQVCVQQTDPLPLDLVSMTSEIAIGGGI